MKAILILFVALTSLTAFGETPGGTNVYLNNSTVKDASRADSAAVVSIENRIRTWSGLCLKGYVNSGINWQSQPHSQNDVLLSFTVGPMDDGNGVGPVGKHIEVIAYDMYVYDSRVKRIVNVGPGLEWFGISKDDATLILRANNTANHLVFMLATMATDGRSQK